MTRRDKLIERIRQRPATASFSDVRSLLEMFGWEHASTKGSHARFTKSGERSITVPIHGGKIGRVYLDNICIRLGLDEETEAH
jgi:predicted RNA binding protein YcfA (HicA-like mRNA interferase family)